MKTILVVVFLSYLPDGTQQGTTTWKKDMKTQEACEHRVEKLNRTAPRLRIYCEAPPLKGGKKA